MTRDQIIAQCEAECQWCRQKRRVHYRMDTREYTHTWEEKGVVKDSVVVHHRMCAAHDLRVKYVDILER